MSANREIGSLHTASKRADRFDTVGIFRLIADKIERDPDLLPEPVSREIAAYLAEAIGRESLFHSQTGYHADIPHPTIVESLPPGWESRLVPMAGFENVFALDPYDLAATKLVGSDHLPAG